MAFYPFFFLPFRSMASLVFNISGLIITMSAAHSFRGYFEIRIIRVIEAIPWSGQVES